jgi:acetyl esterase
MNYRELIDPELRKSAKSFPFNKPVVAVGNVYQGAEWRFVKAPEGIREEEIEIEGSQGHLFRTSVFTPAGAEDYLPALLYVHGGAFVYKAASYQKRLAFIYAEKAECKVFFPHYRLAPKFRFPAAYEDVLSLCRYMMEHAIELGIDPDRIGIGGDSAGGSIAALICCQWEREKISMPCLQMLAYPVTDAEMVTDSMKRFTDTPKWNARNNERMWNYYCGENQGLRKQASPMQAVLPGKIPQTYIETAQFDCLHDEGLLFARKLKEAGADVEINDTQGTFHGYDDAFDAQIVRKNIERRISFLRKRFGGDLQR